MASVERDEEASAATPSTASPSADATFLASGEGTGERWKASMGAAGSETSTGQALSDQTAAKMRAYRNLRYHEDRQSHYERLGRVTNFLTVILGSASFASLFAGSQALAGIGTAAVTVIGAAQLVFDFSRQAKDEEILKAESAKIVAIAERAGADPSLIEADLALLYGRELETYHAVNAMAYNATQLAFGRPNHTLLVVKWWQKWLRHIRTFAPDDFPDKQTA